MISIGKIVYFQINENIWDKPFIMKRHHVYDKIRSVILKGIVIDVKGFEFKAKLIDNNGFEKDNEEFVFNNNMLLSNQNFYNFETLGKWEIKTY